MEFVFKFYTPSNCYDLPQLERFHVTNPLQLFTLSKEKKKKIKISGSFGFEFCEPRNHVAIHL